MPAGNYNIHADSIPDIDEWGYDTWWDCEDWILWHKLNVQKYGRKGANQKFAIGWGNQSMGSAPLDCMTFNSNFKNYIAKDQELYNIVWDVTGIFKPILKPTTSAVDVIETGSEAISTTARFTKALVPLALILGVGYLGYRIYQKEKQRA